MTACGDFATDSAQDAGGCPLIERLVVISAFGGVDTGRAAVIARAVPHHLIRAYQQG